MACIPLRPPHPASEDFPPDRLDPVVAELSELLDRLRSDSDDDVQSSLEALARRREFRVIQGGAL